ncbi:hypothetical protein Mpsy_1093 [Methanolobus psychrophilus R15]|nr:hypothetical protein Mpsy_1093 [Methanolobus psychrophilus R15]
MVDVQVILTVIAIIAAIVIPVFIYKLNIKRKRLQCVIYPNLSLIDIKPQIRDYIEIHYKGEIVNNLSMLEVKIVNNGDIPITQQDISIPLTFEFSDNANLISDEVIEKNPKEIEVIVLHNSSREGTLKYSFDLLNQKDYFKIRFTCIGKSPKLNIISAHIKDIKNLEIKDLNTVDENEKVFNFSNAYDLLKIVVLLIYFLFLMYIVFGGISLFTSFPLK